MSESARAPSVRRVPRAPLPASTTETSVPPRENPAGSAKNLHSRRRLASPAENRVPSPAFAFQPECPAPRRLTHPAFPDTAASSAPYPDPAALLARPELPFLVSP